MNHAGSTIPFGEDRLDRIVYSKLTTTLAGQFLVLLLLILPTNKVYLSHYQPLLEQSQPLLHQHHKPRQRAPDPLLPLLDPNLPAAAAQSRCAAARSALCRTSGLRWPPRRGRCCCWGCRRGPRLWRARSGWGRRWVVVPPLSERAVAIMPAAFRFLVVGVECFLFQLPRLGARRGRELRHSGQV